MYTIAAKITFFFLSLLHSRFFSNWKFLRSPLIQSWSFLNFWRAEPWFLINRFSHKYTHTHKHKHTRTNTHTHKILCNYCKENLMITMKIQNYMGGRGCPLPYKESIAIFVFRQKTDISCSKC